MLTTKQGQHIMSAVTAFGKTLMRGYISSILSVETLTLSPFCLPAVSFSPDCAFGHRRVLSRALRGCVNESHVVLLVWNSAH